MIVIRPIGMTRLDPGSQALASDHRTSTKSPKRRRGTPPVGRTSVRAWRILVARPAALAIGAWGNYSQQQEVMATAKQERDFVPSLRVATVEPSPDTVSVFLPGTTAAFAAANIYARATGYIAKRNVDIGDRVKAGDLLAQLAVPELDDQISQNEATLNQLKSALDAGGGEPRTRAGDMGPRRTLGQQRLGDRSSRAQSMSRPSRRGRPQSPSRNTTSRPRRTCSSSFVRTGITPRWSRRSTASSPSATSMSAVWCRAMPRAAPSCSRSCRRTSIRVSVYVPQDAAFGVTPGIDAIVRVPELPDREFAGTVTRIADALQPGTRTLLTRNRHTKSRRRSGAWNLLHGRTAYPAQVAEPFGAGRCDYLQPQRNEVAVVNNGKAEIRKVRREARYGHAA